MKHRNKCSTHRITLFALPFGILALAVMSVVAAPAEPNRSAIPFEQLGAAASKRYTGDGLSITQGAEGVSMRCVFQKMQGRVTSQGLWLTSTAEPSKRSPFRVVAQSVGREHSVPTPLASVGEVQSHLQTVRFHRVGLDEEYAVSVDGVRQDFVVLERPAGAGELAVRLAVSGVKVEYQIQKAESRNESEPPHVGCYKF